jgi:hypothetical protein
MMCCALNEVSIGERVEFICVCRKMATLCDSLNEHVVVIIQNNLYV